MNQEEYDFLSRLVMRTSGLHLGPNKQYLLESRLIPLAQSFDLEGIPELVARLRRSDALLETAVTEAMTTNETSFFRDITPFDELRDTILPTLIADRGTSKSLRIWCSASSTGQEPFSIAILLHEHFPEIVQNWRVEILATDIAEKMVSRCRSGEYSQLEVQRGLPIRLMVKHFEQCDGGWRVKDDLRKLVSFRRQNLLESFRHLGRFDVVFCRNVLIYFDAETKGRILGQICGCLHQDGFLVLGAAETVIGLSESFDRFRDCKSAVYRPKADSACTVSR